MLGAEQDCNAATQLNLNLLCFFILLAQKMDYLTKRKSSLIG
jgi:hypothetical protein